MNKYALRVQELDGQFVGNKPIHLSEADLIAFEKEIGYSLLIDYREFLRDFGGYSFYAGYPIRNHPLT